MYAYTNTVVYVYTNGTIACSNLDTPTAPSQSTATYYNRPVARHVAAYRPSHDRRRAEASRHRRPPHVPDDHVVGLEIAVREPPRAMRWFTTVVRRN